MQKAECRNAEMQNGFCPPECSMKPIRPTFYFYA